MNQLPKWVWFLIVLVIIFGIIIVTNFHGGASVGMGSKSLSVGVQ